MRPFAPAAEKSFRFRFFGGLDKLPKFGVFLQGFILTHLDPGAEEKIFKRVAAQNAMNQHAERMALKVNPVIAQAEAVQNMTITLQPAEIFQLTANDMLRQPAKVPQDLELQFLGHAPEFGSAGGREDDLKRVHQ